MPLKLILKIEKIYDKVRSFFLTNYSLSFWSVIKFFLIAFFNFALYFIPFYVTILLSIPENQKISSHQWIFILFGSIFMVVVNYFVNKLRDLRKNRRLVGDKIIYDIIGGAIQELRELHIICPTKRERFTTEILTNIEKVLESIFNTDGIESGTLCANLMIRDGSHLKLTDFGTKFQGRDKPQIDFDELNPLPGAPEAWVSNKVIYIDDIKSKKFEKSFAGNFKFRSFISIPVANDGTVIAIINIDSNIEKQFKSDEYIAQKIMPKISPFLSLFSFEQELRKLKNLGGNNA
jgi:hypothetical protein